MTPNTTEEQFIRTHCVIRWRGEDAKQAGNTASNARQHALTLQQRPIL